MKEYAKIKPIWQQIEIFCLTDEEKKALSLIKALQPSSADYSEKLGTILGSYCQSIESFVKLAIYSPPVKKWCQESKQMASTWSTGLTELGVEKAFSYRFKKQKHISPFGLLAGLILFNEYLIEPDSNAAKITILYVAMQSFCSFHATYLIVSKGLEILSHGENQPLLNKLIHALEIISSTHGSPGYILYALFTFRISQFYHKKNPEDKRISNFMHCCFRSLLTAQLLEKASKNEMANADFGHGDLFTKLIQDSNVHSNKPLTKLLEVVNIFGESKSVKPIKEVAMSEAKQLAHQYLKTAQNTI